MKFQKFDATERQEFANLFTAALIIWALAIWIVSTFTTPPQ